MSVSIIIPARNEAYLEKTIRNVLDNAEGEIEVIAVLDGYLPDPQIDMHDDRVKFLHYEKSIGQRQAINAAARIATGDYIMKLDAHCAVGKGFDVILAADCEYTWTMLPTMYNLDVETWQPKLKKITNYMYMAGTRERLLRAEYYEGKEKDEKRRQPKNDLEIDDTMCIMGPCFFMHKQRFWDLGGCDEAHGGWGQQGVEVACKAWLSGGALKVNKKTWFAHWFRGGGGPGFPYHMSGNDQERARKYSKDLWLNDKWPLATRKFQWLLDKFDPPGWKKPTTKKESKVRLPIKTDERSYYHATISKHKVNWMGTRIIKYPGDLFNYQEILFENQPDFIIETGTERGGSALFFAHMFDIIGKGQVISIDVEDRNPPTHERITHLIGPSTDANILAQVKEMVAGGTVMVSLDSDHHRRHVKREMRYYGPMVTPGQYMVVEDTNYPIIRKKNSYEGGPDEAVAWYLASHGAEWEVVPWENKWMFSNNPGGWLRKR